MSTRNAFIVAVLLVLPGVLLRVAPYVERLIQPRASREAQVVADSSSPALPSGLGAIPSALSQRPLSLIVAGFGIEVTIHIIAIVVLLRSSWFVRLLAGETRRSEPGLASSAGWRPQVMMRALLFAMLVAGFLAGSPRSFPFVAWRMYSGIPEQPPSAYVVTGTTRNDASVRIDFGHILPMLGTYRGYNLVAVRASAIRHGDAEQSTSELNTALLSVGRFYNRQNPEDPIERLSVTWAAIPLETRERPWLHDERLVAAVEVD